MPSCPSCGEQNADWARFCQVCGTPLSGAEPRPAESRKTVSVLFTDLVGSTSMGERLDPESLRRVMGRYFDAMRSILEAHGGTVEKFIGDAIMAVFGIPQLHEDDALRAVRAAAAMRDRLEELNAELRGELGVDIVARTGVNTGEVVAGDPSTGQSLVTGDAVNTAARLEQAAGPGEVLLGASTYQLTRDAVVAEIVDPVVARGKSEPLPAFRLVELISGAEPRGLRLAAPMVGRERELGQLLASFDDVLRERACRLVTVVGDAGIGKSRLVSEALGRLGDRALVLRGRCLPYGEGITYWPVAQAVRQAAGITDEMSVEEARQRIIDLLPADDRSERVAGHIAELVGLGGGSRVAEEAFWAVRRFVEGVARQRPVVLAFDDIQWGEETFLDLLAYVVGWTDDVPVLVVCLARKSLLERRPAWTTSIAGSTLITLEPLEASESVALLRELLGVDETAQPVTAAIAEAAAGNPLFVEEMLSMLIDRGLLQRENGRWRSTTPLVDVPVPPTVQALLATRLEQLEAGERRVLEGAAVVGEVFEWGAVTELAPPEFRLRLGALLMSLVRKEVIRNAPSDLAGGDAFRFRHILLRDAAYEAIPKGRRADLHERVARWLEREAEARLPEVQEIVGHHLERAVEYRMQLGHDPRDLAKEAARHLREAGVRALARADFPGAASLLGRAVGLLPKEDPAWPAAALELTEALQERGEFERMARLVTEGVEAARATSDRMLEMRFELVRASMSVFFEPARAVYSDVIEMSLAIADEAAALGDPLTQGEALIRAGRLLNDTGRSAESAQLFERARACFEGAGISSLELAFIQAVFFVWRGPDPIDEVFERLEGMRSQIDVGSPADGLSILGIAVVWSMRGDFEKARTLVRQGSAILEELGMTVLRAASGGLIGAIVELLAGDARRAEEALRPGYQTLKAMGDKGRLSSRGAFLALVMYEQGRYDEAMELADEAEEIASDDDVEPHIWGQVVRAMVLARRGRLDEAVAEARRAVDLSERTDWTDYQGTAWMALSQVALLARRPREAAEAARTAAQRFDAKGNLVMADRGRRVLAQLGEKVT